MSGESPFIETEPFLEDRPLSVESCLVGDIAALLPLLIVLLRCDSSAANKISSNSRDFLRVVCKLIGSVRRFDFGRVDGFVGERSWNIPFSPKTEISDKTSKTIKQHNMQH